LLISPATLQAYRAEADFAKHIHQLQQTLGAPQRSAATGPATTPPVE
jgi:hypothetical protein